MKNDFFDLIKKNSDITIASMIWMFFLLCFGCAPYLKHRGYISEVMYVSMVVYSFGFVFFLVFYGCDSVCKSDCQIHAKWLKPTSQDLGVIAGFILFAMTLIYLTK